MPTHIICDFSLEQSREIHVSTVQFDIFHEKQFSFTENYVKVELFTKAPKKFPDVPFFTFFLTSNI